MVDPAVAVDGVGAVALPVPPVAVVYHNNAVPVAVNGAAAAPWQYVTGVVPVGAGVVQGTDAVKDWQSAPSVYVVT